ncbi:hypothetical protein EBR96_03890 [bacterium]|nr:hypothetical protein [bacterium]
MTKKTTTGAETLIRCLETQGVEVIFGYPGGAAIPIFDALVDSKIKLVLVRHEQGATHIADGYARATGKPGVVLVTSGPGATNTVTGIITAIMDSVPMIVLCGQTITSALGKDAFQEADVFGITAPIVKHSYLVKNPNDIPRIVEESFHICNTGRPGPVVIDLPKDITSAPCSASVTDNKMDLPGYSYPTAGHKRDIQKLASLLKTARRPLLLIGHGAEISGADAEVRKLAETLKAPVVNTLLGKGVFPENHPLSLGMLGMHGTAYANKALTRCDLIFSIGSRWDDRITPGKIERFCPNAVKLHIDIDPAEINKVVVPDASQFFKTHKPRTWISSGGAGTMGYGFPAAIGAQFGCPKETVIAIVGDGGFQMTLFELSTAMIHKLPIKIVVIDNKYLGMVRQWQQLFYDDRLSGVDLEGNPDFVKVAEAYGIKGFRIKRAADVRKILNKALNYNEGPCLIHAEVIKEDNVFPMIPAGGAAEDMIIDPPKTKLEKPKGST